MARDGEARPQQHLVRLRRGNVDRRAVVSPKAARPEPESVVAVRVGDLIGKEVG